jgi:hypothetical protein
VKTGDISGVCLRGNWQTYHGACSSSLTILAVNLQGREYEERRKEGIKGDAIPCLCYVGGETS